jgi:alkylation response protein AidB-like acyl-CoA dehydrogenase
MNESIPEPAGNHPQLHHLEELLNRAQALCDLHIAPRANLLDQGSEPPAEAVAMLAEAGLLGLTVPAEYGGHGAPGTIVRRYTEILSAACATTTFVQGQHLSACNLLVQAGRQALLRSVLPEFAAGRRICGIAFSHLRRPGKPLLTAAPVKGGFRLQGEAPWFTGWGIMTDTILGATLPDGRYLYSVVPIDTESMSASDPLPLCAMNASATVVLSIHDLFVPEEAVFKTITPQEMEDADRSAILNVLPQIFGVATASLRLLREYADIRKSASAGEAAAALQAELEAHRAAADAWRSSTADPEYSSAALRIRASAIEFGVRCAHAALAAGGGGANHRNHTAQRLCREALFYSLTAQTRDIQTALLQHLTDTARRSVERLGCP